jgi:hypothetical protein
MNMYPFERMVREQHEEMVQRAEELSRLQGYDPGERLAERVASQLRRLADRIDGRHPTRVWIHPG